MEIKGFRVKSHLEIETRSTPPKDPVHGSIYVDKNGRFYIYINGAWRELIDNNTVQTLSNKIIDKTCKIEVQDINCVNINIDGYLNGIDINNILSTTGSNHTHQNINFLNTIDQELSSNSSPSFQNIYIKNNILVDGYINNIDINKLKNDVYNHIDNNDLHNIYEKTCDDDVNVLDVVYLSNDIARKASASNILTAVPFGVVVKKIGLNKCVIKTRGIIDGFSGLIPNKNILLSRVSGKITQTTNGLLSGECVVVIGRAISSTTVFIDNYNITILASDR